MHHEASRLIDYYNVGILVNDAERNGLGGRFRRRRLQHVNRDGGGGIDAMAGIADRAAVDCHRTGFDQAFEPGARELSDMSGEQAIEPAACLLIIDADLFLRMRHCNDQVPKWPCWLPS